MNALAQLESLPLDNDDDSPFLSMADFFSLISLTFIYIAVVFGTPIAASDSLEIVQAAEAKPGTAVPRDPNKAYVALWPSDSANGILIRVVPSHGATIQEKSIAFPASDSDNVADWVTKTLDTGTPTDEVMLFLPRSEVRQEALSLFVELSRRLPRTYRVRPVT